MEDTFKAYGITKHIPGNINFNEIKNLVERNEISDVFKKIDLKFRDLDKRAVLIIGEPASGKTSIALSTGYKLWNTGFKKQVFYWNLNNNKGRKNIENSFSCLINDIKKTHHEIVLIIEDIHNNIDTFENLIIPLISSNENLAVILTSRNIGNFESTGESSEYTSFN
jgi:DNA replication protein DnaC